MPEPKNTTVSGLPLSIPAFILGNSPRLPVDDLSVLDSLFTVGVNRIVQVYAPTVLLWVDGTAYKDIGEQMDNCGALMVCDASVHHRQFHIGLKTWVGDNALKRESTPVALCCNGNTGCCAARWALALGCKPVYLVGMDARYDVTGPETRTDFYGVNKWHRRTPENDGTLHVMRKELDRLLRDFPEDVIEIFDGIHLQDVAAECWGQDQGELRKRVKKVLFDGGAQIAIA